MLNHRDTLARVNLLELLRLQDLRCLGALLLKLAESRESLIIRGTFPDSEHQNCSHFQNFEDEYLMRARRLVMTQDLTHFRLGLREIPAGGLPGILVLFEFVDLVH